ncbi:MAG: hypothetical protein AAF304_03960 [Pseudomonadota bacterium]
MAEIHSLEEICSNTHEILQVATKNLPIPDKDRVRDVRKMISVFTYSIIRELAKEQDVHEDDIYLRYLMGGGLSSSQAHAIVNRTRDEFLYREFGDDCMQAGKEVVIRWRAGDDAFQSNLHDLLT